MRNTILLLSVTMLFSGCFTYQYYNIGSSQLPQDDRHSYFVDNDTMRLNYDFNGAGGYLTITLFNKSHQVIFINWSKSALIYKDQSYSLAQTSAGFMAPAVRNGVGTEVPPNTKVSQIVMNLNLAVGLRWMVLPDSSRPQSVRLPEGARRSYRSAEVDEGQSPLQAKVFLTFVMGPGNGTEFSESHNFYIAKVLQTSNPPDRFPLYQNNGQFFMRRNN